MHKRTQEAYIKTAAGGRTNVKIIRNTAAVGADYYIKPYENVVVVINTAGQTYDQVLYLPRIGESVGQKIFIVFVITGNGTNFILDNDDSFHPAWTDLTPDTDADYVVLENTGRGWAILAGSISS